MNSVTYREVKHRRLICHVCFNKERNKIYRTEKRIKNKVISCFFAMVRQNESGKRETERKIKDFEDTIKKIIILKKY